MRLWCCYRMYHLYSCLSGFVPDWLRTLRSITNFLGFCQDHLVFDTSLIHFPVWMREREQEPNRDVGCNKRFYCVIACLAYLEHSLLLRNKYVFLLHNHEGTLGRNQKKKMFTLTVFKKHFYLVPALHCFWTFSKCALQNASWPLQKEPLILLT